MVSVVLKIKVDSWDTINMMKNKTNKNQIIKKIFSTNIFNNYSRLKHERKKK